MGHHVHHQHPTLHYHGTYYDFDEAMNCWHVQTAAKHHKINLHTLAKALSTGLTLTAAVASIIGFILIL